jgi:hypothetical protein
LPKEKARYGVDLAYKQEEEMRKNFSFLKGRDRSFLVLKKFVGRMKKGFFQKNKIGVEEK